MHRFTHDFLGTGLAIVLGGCLLTESALAWDITCHAGPNPWYSPDVSDPTLYAISEWDSWDLISYDTIWMNSIAFGPGCVESCILLLPEVAHRAMTDFPLHQRPQVLNVYLGGSYTFSGAAKLMKQGQYETELDTCTVSGLVAPARPGGGH